MNIFCQIGLHNWEYFIEAEGYGKFVPVCTQANPKARLCHSCCRKEYLQDRTNMSFSGGIDSPYRKKYVKRDPSVSDIRKFKINKILNN